MEESSVVMPPPLPPPVLTSPPAASAVTADASNRSTPAMSPAFASSGGRSGRGLRQKVVDEIKNVRTRKSPAQEKRMVRPTPPPLVLNEEMGEEEDEEVSPGTPVNGAQGGGKAKGCSICERSFTVFRAKHTCKMCAQKICDDCSKNRMKLHRRLERKKGSRLCDPCARNCIHPDGTGGEGTPGLFPDRSPGLVAMHSENTLRGKQSGDLAGLPRRHSVPAKTISAFIHSQKKEESASPNGKPSHQQTTSNTSARTRAPSRGSRIAHPSHLRLRHWLSLLAVAVLVLLRIFYYSRSSGVNGNALAATTTNSTVVASPPYSFVERTLDSLLSMRTLGTYVLGLVLFDELRRTKTGKKGSSGKRRKSKRRQRQHVTTSTGESQGRTVSSLSDTSVASKRHAIAAPPTTPPSSQTSQEDDLEVDTGDTEGNHDEEGFTLDKLIAALDDGAKFRAAQDGKLRLSTFTTSCHLICGFLSVFGRATSFAGSTVGGYFTSIQHNLDTWPAPPGASSPEAWKEYSVKAIIEREVELKVANVGGKKKPSCSRCLLRLVWFVEFVESCVRHTLLDSTDENCSIGASKAYEETIGQRHPWLIRKGVNSALSAIPLRSHILASLHLTDDEEGLAPLRKAHDELTNIVTELKSVFEEHNLQELK